MPRKKTELLYVGIRDSVVALDQETGAEVWRTKLKGSDFVNLHWSNERLYATSRGEAFCLNPATGAIVWHNPLKGLGWGLASMVAASAPAAPLAPYVTLAEAKRRQDAAGAGAAAAAG